MKRLLLLAPVLLLVVAGCGGSDASEPAASTPSTAAADGLKVTVWADPSTTAEPTVTTVVVPAGAKAADFAAVPADQACTMIFGGPGIATVVGTVEGQAVNAQFNRGGGCEIARWDRMVELGIIPAGVGSL